MSDEWLRLLYLLTPVMSPFLLLALGIILVRKCRDRLSRRDDPQPFRDWLMTVNRKFLEKHTAKHLTIYTMRGHHTPNVMGTIESVLSTQFDRFTVDLLLLFDNVCVIQIPAKNFKCGRDFGFNEYHPTVGESSGSYITNQLVENNVLNIATYHEGGRSYMAGLTIYLRCGSKPSSYSPSALNAKLATLMSKANTYWPKKDHLQPESLQIVFSTEHAEPVVLSENGIGDRKTQKMDWEQKTFSILSEISPARYQRIEERQVTNWRKKRLAVKYCHVAREAVMVGWMNGVVVHILHFGTTQFSECAGCSEVPPPSYDLIYS